MRLKKIVFTQTLKGSTLYIIHTYLYSLVNEASMLMGMIYLLKVIYYLFQTKLFLFRLQYCHSDYSDKILLSWNNLREYKFNTIFIYHISMYMQVEKLTSYYLKPNKVKKMFLILLPGHFFTKQ